MGYVNKFIIITVSILWSALTLAAGYIVKPEQATEVALSNLDVNRVVCDGGNITDVFYSEEKGVVVKTRGKDAFVKIKMKRKVSTGEIIRPVISVDLHVVCAGDVYTIIGSLKHIPSQTIRLKSGTKRLKKNLRLLGAMPEEKRYEWIITKAYKNDYPDTFTVKVINKPFGELDNLYIDIARQIRIEGMGLRLTEYSVTANSSGGIHETMFLQEKIGKHIVAVSLDTESHQLEEGDKFRAFVIEKVKN